MRLRSIRMQLLAWASAFLAVVLTAILATYFVAQQRGFRAGLDAHLRARLVQLLPLLRESGVPPGTLSPHVRAGLDDLTERRGGYAQVLGEDGRIERQYGELPEGSPPRPRRPPLPGVSPEAPGFREVRTPSLDGRTLIVGMPASSYQAVQVQSPSELALLGLGIWVIGLLGIWLIAGQVLQPIHAMSRTAEGIAAGESQRRVELGNSPEELEGLGQALNDSYDALEHALQAQQEFSANASHELRTPVSVILAQTEAVLKQAREPAEYQEALEACRRAGQRMKGLITRLLELSRMDRGSEALHLTELDVSELVREAIQEARPLGGDFEIDVQIPEDPVVIKADPERLYLALTNLIVNAIRHNPTGCKVELSLRADESGIAIDVADDGVGLDADGHPELFERFYRVDMSRTQASGGSGLGLALVKAVVDLHGGDVSVTSELGEGATFTLSLPKDASQDPGATEAS